MAFGVVVPELANVQQFELRARQVGQFRDRKTFPIGIPGLERQEEDTIIFGERGVQRVDQAIKRCLMIVVGEGLERHAFELGPEGLPLILAFGIDEFGDRAVVADEGSDQSHANLICDALSFEQARDELVRVVAELEQGAPTLEHSLTLWTRGEALAARCEEWLVGAKRLLDATRPTDAEG